MASAKNELKEAMIKLAAVKDIDKISVDEIIKEAGVSRTIFYKLFQDKYDLAYYVFEDEIGSVVYSHYMNHRSHLQISIEVIKLLGDNQTFYRKLFMARGGYETFAEWLTDYYVRTQGESIGKLKLTPEIQLLQYIYCSGLCMMEKKWVMGELPPSLTEENLAQIIVRACPPELAELLG